MSDLDLDALEALTQYRPPRWETIPVQVPIDTAVLRALIQRLREAETTRLQLDGENRDRKRVIEHQRFRIAELERVREAAERIATLNPGAYAHLRELLTAVEDSHAKP